MRSPKIVPECDLPLTAVGAVHRVITDMGVFEFVDRELNLIEFIPGSSLEEIRAQTRARFKTTLQ